MTTQTVRQIMLNTDVQAPNFCFEVLPVRMKGEKTADMPNAIFVQSDWDYAPFAQAFGWSINAVQICRRCGKQLDLSSFMGVKIEDVGTHGMDEAREQQEQWKNGELAVKCESCGFRKTNRRAGNVRCEHNGDGTVSCKTCGAKTGDFLAAAYDFIMANDGAVADDPGYFDQE